MSGESGESAGASGPRPVLAATLDCPVPMQGLHDQHLGMVTRFWLSQSGEKVSKLELQTQWQTIEIDRAAVIYDAGAHVFRLLRQHEPL